MLVDSHCHLNYFDDIDKVVNNAIRADVQFMQTISVKLTEANQILAIARKYHNVSASIGVHPLEAKDHPDITAEEIIQYTTDPKTIGIGETGLDYYRETNSVQQKRQQDFFRLHINASAQTNIPIIVHTRNADTDTATILSTEIKTKNVTGVMHCFTSSIELAKTALDCGMYISISGIVTYSNAQNVQEITKAIPIDRILIETDAPFLAPVPHRGKQNEPMHITHTAKFIANLLKMEADKLADITTNNFYKLFTKAPQINRD